MSISTAVTSADLRNEALLRIAADFRVPFARSSAVVHPDQNEYWSMRSILE